VEDLHVMPFSIYEFNEIWYNEVLTLHKGENYIFALFAHFCLILDEVQYRICSQQFIE
jgi:hypothetical protein